MNRWGPLVMHWRIRLLCDLLLDDQLVTIPIRVPGGI